MTQVDKELLLLKDLCGRVPYGVKCKYNDGVIVNILSVNFFYKQIEGWERYVNHTLKYDVEDVKPYLFPLSSMTEEQKNELEDTLSKLSLKLLFDEISSEVAESCVIDFYNKKHIDYRGLIPMGLAEDATDKNIY
jgi:hypothetical protein